jgi:hypothetical protein
MQHPYLHLITGVRCFLLPMRRDVQTSPVNTVRLVQGSFTYAPTCACQCIAVRQVQYLKTTDAQYAMSTAECCCMAPQQAMTPNTRGRAMPAPRGSLQLLGKA